MISALFLWIILRAPQMLHLYCQPEHSHRTGSSFWGVVRVLALMKPVQPQRGSRNWWVWQHPHQTSVNSVSPLTLSAIKITGSPPPYSRLWRRLSLGQVRKGKPQDSCQVSEKLRSCPLIQEPSMLSRVLPKSGNEVKEIPCQHNSCQNVNITLWMSQGGVGREFSLIEFRLDHKELNVSREH